MGARRRPRVSTIWTPELAYCVGLIASDGCLSPDGRHISFTSKDRELIEAFRDCLGVRNAIGTKGRGGDPSPRYHVIQIGDITFCEWLVGIGVAPHKSLTMGALAVPDEFFFDFLRGSFDGDGSVLDHRDHRWPAATLVYLRWYSASPAHLDWLAERIGTLAGIIGHRCGGRRAEEIRYGKRAGRILFARMYYDPVLPSLARKRLKAARALGVEDSHVGVAEQADAHG